MSRGLSLLCSSVNQPALRLGGCLSWTIFFMLGSLIPDHKRHHSLDPSHSLDEITLKHEVHKQTQKDVPQGFVEKRQHCVIQSTRL